ncbi:MAG: hypothetical protein AB1409_08320 [Pseudomonadota bacterium]
MIIANINGQCFVLDNAKDAEQLLGIFARAKPVERTYDTEYRSYYYPDRDCDCGVEISAAELVSLEEHLRRREERDAREAAEARARATTDGECQS